jgi:formylglycine-generating enzyme required for sulfatase activity
VAELCQELSDGCEEARPIRRLAFPLHPQPGEEWVTGRDGSVLVYVPGGEYLLGSDDLSECEQPVHRAILNAFWIGKYPVTNEQYASYLKANPKVEKPEFWDDKRFNQPWQPVVGVSWQDANGYCGWAGLQLPSEAQWEAAARGLEGRRFPWGSEEPTPEHANFDGREGQTTPVGASPKGAGPFGTLDQAGNLWEWCEDIWDPSAYGKRDGKRDPLSTAGEAAIRCLRGGSWYHPAKFLAAAYRYRDRGSYRLGLIGFRCLLPGSPRDS